MTALLLDSNALLWWALGNGRLSDAAREAIEAPQARVCLSIATAWELEIKRQSGKLGFDISAWRDASIVELDLLLINLDDALSAARLPAHHRDPFDRMIIAQALNRGLTVVTSDQTFELYGVLVLRV